MSAVRLDRGHARLVGEAAVERVAHDDALHLARVDELVVADGDLHEVARHRVAGLVGPGSGAVPGVVVGDEQPVGRHGLVGRAP